MVKPSEILKGMRQEASLDIGAPFSLQECTNNKNVAHGRYKGSISLEQKNICHTILPADTR
jgi:hypothetical protein